MNTTIRKQDLKKFCKCEIGSVSVLGLFVTVFIISAMATIYKKMINENKETRERIDTYICFKHGLKKIKQSHKKIFYTNKSITLLNLSKALNPGPHIEVAKRLIQTTQYLSYLSFVQSILFKKECHLWNKRVLLAKYPYKLSALKDLKRLPSGHAILKTQKEAVKLTSYRNLKKPFALHAKYRFEPFFVLKKSKEISASMTILAL